MEWNGKWDFERWAVTEICRRKSCLDSCGRSYCGSSSSRDSTVGTQSINGGKGERVREREALVVSRLLHRLDVVLGTISNLCLLCVRSPVSNNFLGLSGKIQFFLVLVLVVLRR